MSRMSLAAMNDSFQQYVGESTLRDCRCETKAVVGVLGGVVVYATIKKILGWQRKKHLDSLVTKRKQERQTQLDDLTNRLTINGTLITPQRERILKLDAETLLKKLKDSSLTAVEVLQAYQAKAIEAQNKCNCVTEFLPEAEEWARACDKSANKSLALHGLPVSIKEDFPIANHDVTLGYPKFIGVNYKTDSVPVQAVKRLGGIPFCRTNVPQTIICFVSTNPVYGNTSHPTHPSRSCGGSTGGEAALIACGGSILGVGSDIAGSLRIPSQFCGVCTLKPTFGRFSQEGQMASIPGNQGLLNVPGFLAKDVDTVLLATKELFQSEVLLDLDPRSAPVAWRDEIFDDDRRLRIGYYTDSNVFPVTPGVKRSVETAVKALESAGHVVVPFACPDSWPIIYRMMKLLQADGGRIILDRFDKGEIDSALYSQYWKFTVPSWIWKLLLPYIRWTSKRSTFLFGATESWQLWKAMYERNRLIVDEIARWKKAEIDVLIAPGFACPAVNHKYAPLLLTAGVHTMLWNHLDFPVGSVPVTKETAADQKKLETWDTQGDKLLKEMKEAVRGGEGLPLGVQVIGLPWQEELVLRAMKELQDALRE